MARKRRDVPPDRVAALNRGELATANLVETLVVNYRQVMAAAFPALPEAVLEAVEAARAEGIVKGTREGGRLLREHLPPAEILRLRRHPSDTVRAWVCYALGQNPALTWTEALDAIRPLAGDGQWGVREWAWMAMRERVAEDPDRAIASLVPWTAEPEANLRRFATELTRPRGVWCAHIRLLRQEPARGLPLLEPLRADPAKYVQDSVANWLNDASKDQPAWVEALCGRWRKEHPQDPRTDRICRRALRTLHPTGKRTQKRPAS